MHLTTFSHFPDKRRAETDGMTFNLGKKIRNSNIFFFIANGQQQTLTGLYYLILANGC